MENELYPLKDTKDFGRDLNSKALIFTNKREQQQYFLKKSIQEQQNKKHETIENRINKIETDILDIKDLLLKLLEKNS